MTSIDDFYNFIVQRMCINSEIISAGLARDYQEIKGRGTGRDRDLCLLELS